MEQFTPLKRVPSYIELADRITSLILEGKLVPGDFLPIEHVMAEQFEVNRSTLREGLRVLEQSGLVRRSGKRLLVQQPSHKSVSQVTGRALVLHDVSFSDILEVGTLLFPASAELASKHATDKDKADIKENLETTKNALNNPDELALIDIQFLQLVAKASGNGAMLISLEPLSRILYAGFHPVFSKIPVAAERMLDSHNKIYEAILTGDAISARHWMEKHVEDFRRGFESAGFSMDDKISDSDVVISTFKRRSS